MVPEESELSPDHQGEQGPKLIAIVVGATGAFGQSICKRLLSRGLRVIAVGRTHTSLERMAQDLPDLHICSADISSDESIERISRSINGKVKAVVHGPGVGVAGGSWKLIFRF